MKNESLLIEFAKFIGKDESDINAFEEYLEAKCEKKFNLIYRNVNGIEEYGVFVSYNSGFYIKALPKHYFRNPYEFIREVNRLINEGYILTT